MSRGLMGRPGRGTAKIQNVRIAPTRPLDGQIQAYNAEARRYEPVDQTTGTGVPTGGTTGQVLTKQSNTDGDADWETVTGGGGGVTTVTSLDLADSSVKGNLYLLDKSGDDIDRLFIGVQTGSSTYKYARIKYEYLTAGGAFDANNISGLQVWYKSDTLVLTNGDLVGTWADSSANGNNATQTVSSNKPSYVTNVVNGLPIVRFDGNDHLNLSNFTAGPSTLFIVANYRGGGANQGAVFMCTNLGLYIDSDEWQPYYGGFVSTGITADTTYLSMGVVTRSPSDIDFLVNNAPAISIVGSSYNSRSAGVIGTDDSYSQYSQVDIAEVMVWDRALDSGEVTAVREYLSDKYGFS